MKTILGDILDINHGVILHQVNCIQACGGLAGALKRTFPQAFKVYFNDARSPELRLGTSIIGCQSPDLFIAHVFGQYYPGPYTDLTAVEMALKDLRENLALAGSHLPIYAPHKIGCGLGGGDWQQYSALLEKYFPDITIVQKYA